MFRKPTEISSDSSSGSSSASDEPDEPDEPDEEVIHTADNSDDIVEFNATDTLSLSVNEDASQGAVEPSSDQSYHSHMILATLLVSAKPEIIKGHH